MSGTVAIIMFIIGAGIGLFLLGGWLLREFRSILPFIFVGTLITISAAWFLFTLLGGVLSVEGLKYSLGLGPAGNLTWPSGVRVTTYLLLAELGVLGAWIADHRAGRGPRTARPIHNWAWAHISAPSRVGWHLLIAPLMVIRDRVYNRALAWPVRPEHRFELAALLGDLAADMGRGLTAVTSPRRWALWIGSRRVNRTVPMPVEAIAPMTVPGEVLNVETIQTWCAPSGLPTQRDRKEKTAV